MAIREYVAIDNPGAASRIAAAILATVRRLERFPNSGRPGRVLSTREAPMAGTPYVIVYRVDIESIGIVHVIHGNRQWPPVGESEATETPLDQ
jgi:toxin ParE1/3/4